MLFRECSCKNAGVAGYAEAFTAVLSGKQASETGGYLVWIILGIEGLDLLFLEQYMEEAEHLTDSRQQAKVKHSMKDVVGIVFFAVLAGNDEWSEIYDFALDEREVLEKYLELPNWIPSHDTIQRLSLS